MQTSLRLAALALVAACGGAPPPTPAPPPSNTPAAGSATPASVGSASLAITSTESYDHANEVLLAKFGVVLQIADCDQAAAALVDFVDANRDTLFSIRAWEKAHPDDEHAFDASHRDVEQRATDLMVHCRDNPAFLAALQRFPSG